MERWIIDTSILAQAYVADTESAHVFVLLDQLSSPSPAEIHVPEFCILECANVFWKRARFHGEDEATIKRSLQDLLDVPLIYHQVTPLLPRALAVGLSYGIAIYDSIYVALAEALDCPLITVDQRQATAAEQAGITLKPITDFVEPDGKDYGD